MRRRLGVGEEEVRRPATSDQQGRRAVARRLLGQAAVGARRGGRRRRRHVCCFLCCRHGRRVVGDRAHSCMLAPRRREQKGQLGQGRLVEGRRYRCHLLEVKTRAEVRHSPPCWRRTAPPRRPRAAMQPMQAYDEACKEQHWGDVDAADVGFSAGAGFTGLLLDCSLNQIQRPAGRDAEADREFQ
uniref:Uncharacterized protein n=1 Tax=Oryza rufipogon TaxID=4529 RepID=A0A0E0MWJ0_ORYRU